MNENTQLFLLILTIMFALMFIVHTISDYNSLDRAMKYCIVAKEGPEPIKHE